MFDFEYCWVKFLYLDDIIYIFYVGWVIRFIEVENCIDNGKMLFNVFNVVIFNVLKL